jgi:hypothetical protein
LVLSLPQAWKSGEIQFEHFWYFHYWKPVLAALIVLAALPLVVKYWWLDRLKAKGARLRAGFRLRSWRFDAMWSLIFVGLGMVIFMISLEPVWQRRQDIPEKAAIKVAVAMDGSASTLAAIHRGSDESRWDVIKKSVNEVFKKLPYDRKGFVIFASRIIARSGVITTDYERILKPELDDITEWFIADVGQGTNFAFALRGCYELLSVDDSEGVCIILSDGEQQGDQETLEADLAAAIKELKAGLYEKGLSTKVKFYIVPVGDPNEAMKIPKRDFDGNIIGFVCCKNDGRSFIETKPDYAFLARIADVIGGKFVPLERGDELIKAMQEVIEQERKIVAYQPRIYRDDLTWIGFLLILPGSVFLLVYWKK